ncbi:MAG: PilT/PilU family type 4a pilus ATPase [Candidatus Buchananbacteria bacterium]
MLNLDSLFKTAVAEGASDVHLIVGLSPYLRVDGVLKPLTKIEALTAKEVENSVFGLLDQKQIERFKEDRELDLSYEINGGNRFRINLHYEKGCVGLSARLIPVKIPTLEELVMPEATLGLIDQRPGLVLLTGPTGSGKSTTLASMLEHINQTRAENIFTLEDPIEFVFKPAKSIVRQRQLLNDMLTFEAGLVHVLRQDPNVIMVGEMRNLETIATTITLAETGHLVLATLHTYNSAQTIDRIIDSFPPHQQNQIRLQLSLTLKGVISQRLLPKVDGGRIATREVLLNNPAVANLIRENKVPQIKNVIQTAGAEGMFAMDQDIQSLYKKKIISKEVALANLTTTRKI